MITGVNLGNWLVLEKWMSPALFTGTEAEDETQLCTVLDPTARRERLTAHRDSYVTERDFAYLANHGIEAVRIPVPYFVFGDVAPFLGCLEYLDRAFDWASAYGLQILLDLHTVPDSQNGFDNGGLCGVCKWHLDPEQVEFALTVLDRLADRYRDHPALWGIEVLNEPISPELWELIDVPHRYPPADPEHARGSQPVPTEFLRTFYSDAYRRIRAQAPGVTVVFHDGFRIREWPEFFAGAGFTDVVLDTHLYLMVATLQHGDQDLEDYVRVVETEFAPTLAELAPHVPLIVGEWCVNTSSTRVANLTGPERRRYHRTLADAQLRAWRDHTIGWFYWSYKLLVEGAELDGWDFGKSTELHYLPELR